MYDEMDLTAHARRALREFVEYRDILPGKLVKEAQEFLDELEDLLTHFAKAMGLPLDRAEEAVYELELGKRATETGDISSALRHFRRASSLAPRWIAPRGLEGEVLLMDGQPRKAIEVAEQLLKDSPGLQPAIIILVRAHLMLGNREAAEAAARSLRGLSVDSPASLESVVLTLGYLNDDAEIYRLYRQHRHLIKEIEDAPSLIVIGSAAANLGHFRTARRLWEQAMSYPGGLAEALSALMAAAIRKAPGPGIADRYPTFQFVQLMPNRVAREMNELLELWETGEIDRKPFQKRLRGLVARYPIVFSQLVQMFRESASRFLWIDILALLGTPEAVEELRRFAFSQKGKLAERMVALQSLDEEGLMDVSQPVELWDEFRQEWRRLRIPRWRVLENDPDRYPRQAIEILADRKEFTLWEFLVYLRALTAISVSEEDLALARFYVTTALSWHPDDEHFQQLDLVLALQEPDSGLNVLLQQSRQYRERRRSRPIPPDASLRQCLERITRESLVATAKTYSVPYVALRKEDLIQNLVEAITDPERLREALTELDVEERQALRDVLDAGGILPWDEFTARYGDDLEDSLEWSFFLPETLMGRLRLYGLLSDGTVEGQRVVLIPRELRELLPSALAAVEETSDRQDDAV
jgi:tetratricopeptide (TPR) repeat protein